jgi:hypothetical protein
MDSVCGVAARSSRPLSVCPLLRMGIGIFVPNNSGNPPEMEMTYLIGDRAYDSDPLDEELRNDRNDRAAPF